MIYVLTNGERSVLVESKIHRDAYVSSGWWEVAQPKKQSPIVEAAEEVQSVKDNTTTETVPQRRRGGRPRREG